MEDGTQGFDRGNALDLALEVVLEKLEGLNAVVVDEVQGNAVPAEATRAANAVKIGLCWQGKERRRTSTSPHSQRARDVGQSQDPLPPRRGDPQLRPVLFQNIDGVSVSRESTQNGSM